MEGIRFDPAPGIVEPLIDTDLSPEMPEEMSVLPKPAIAPPRFQFEGLPRKYRAKAAYEIARLKQESADRDADSVIQGTYLQDLRAELSQTEQGREALRRQMEAQAPRMPNAMPTVNAGEGLAALLAGLLGGDWNQASRNALAQAGSREGRAYDQEAADFERSQKLLGLDYGEAADKEDQLRRLIQQFQLAQEGARSDAEQAKIEHGYKLEEIEAQNKARIDLADMKTPEGVYRQLLPLVGRDEALRLATGTLNLAAAKAEDVPENRATQNRRVEESARANKAKEKIAAANLDLRKLSIELPHKDRQAALEARIAMFHEGQDNQFKRQYMGHMFSLSKIAAGKSVTDAESKSMGKMYEKLKSSLKTAEINANAARRTVFVLEGSLDPDDPKLAKARMDAIDAETKKDAIESELLATEDALRGIEREVTVDYSNVLAPKVGNRPVQRMQGGFAPLRPDVSGLPGISPEAKAKAKPKGNPLVLGGLDLNELLKRPVPKKPAAKPKAGTVQGKTGAVKWRFK